MCNEYIKLYYIKHIDDPYLFYVFTLVRVCVCMCVRACVRVCKIRWYTLLPCIPCIVNSFFGYCEKEYW